jgi:hypothetical protein
MQRYGYQATKHVVGGTNMQKSAPRLAARLFAPCLMPVIVK